MWASRLNAMIKLVFVDIKGNVLVCSHIWRFHQFITHIDYAIGRNVWKNVKVHADDRNWKTFTVGFLVGTNVHLSKL